MGTCMECTAPSHIPWVHLCFCSTIATDNSFNKCNPHTITEFSLCWPEPKDRTLCAINSTHHLKTQVLLFLLFHCWFMTYNCTEMNNGCILIQIIVWVFYCFHPLHELVAQWSTQACQSRNQICWTRYYCAWDKSSQCQYASSDAHLANRSHYLFSILFMFLPLGVSHWMI